MPFGQRDPEARGALEDAREERDTSPEPRELGRTVVQFHQVVR